MFKKITDKSEIRATLHNYMLRIEEQKAQFIPLIYTREHHKGGMIFEGARPIAARTDCETGEVTYTLSNGDADYCMGIATVKLSLIEYIEVFSKP